MSASSEEQLPRPRDLCVEYEAEPINVDPTTPPRFSWQVETNHRDVRQTAYRVIIGREEETVAEGRGDLWDSGRVDSSAATGVRYGGPSLASNETYHWSVKVWTDTSETDWAAPVPFSTALEPEEWRGEWIAHQPGAGDVDGWRSQWQDSKSASEEWVQVDLGDIRDVSEITLHPANPISIVRTPDTVPVTMSWSDNPLAEFGFPDAYRVEVADDPDFAAATVVAEYTAESAPKLDDPAGQPDDSVAPRTHDGFDARGRYVRVTATDLSSVQPAARSISSVRDVDRCVESIDAYACFALAALTVRADDGTNLTPGDIETSSSVETDTWSRDYLIDGGTESQLASSSPLLRNEFSIEKPVRSARIHVAAVGYGELYVNGERISNRQLDPAWTDYERRVLYATHDISDQLREGSNALGLWLGRGWFAKRSSYWLSDGSPRGRATLTIEFEDGTTRTRSTDGNWLATGSPLLENDIYDGEHYDARREASGWSESDFDDRDWDPASVVDGPGGTLRPERIQPMQVVDTFDVVEASDREDLSEREVPDREDGPIVDFGQNLTGWVEIEIDGADAGDEIRLRHAEALTADGELSTTDLRSADATDTYVARGDGTETYEPQFTYHGFRYAQISGYPGEFDPDAVTAKVVHTAMEPRGEFACSNDDLNQVQHNAVWGLRGNTHSIPEDCPQRDERFGWTGDAHISTRALLFNFDAVRFDEKWARDHDDAASEMGYVPDVIPNKAAETPADPTWSITRVMVPWYLYKHDGDIGVLREQYEGMRAYVEYWLSVADNGILPDTYGKYGDWLAFENTEGRRGLPHDLYNTAFLYQVTDTFSKIAAVLGNETDADAYRHRADVIAAAFNDRFFDADAGVYGPGTQSSYAVPLFLGMVPEGDTELVAENLAATVRADGSKLQTGFLGTRPLIHTLAAHGYTELAYEVVSQPDQPGWVYMARNGATTLWERWNADESVGSGMNSLNHSPFTHVSEFFYAVLAGIQVADAPMTEHVTIAPALVNDLDWVDASVETPNGTLAVAWDRDGDEYRLSTTIPWNTSATIRLPEAADATVAESGTKLHGRTDGSLSGLRTINRDAGDVVLEVGSGTYEFEVV
ncbi:alpha-L-rhamnosidase [Halocatena pleomorpha]|uniref:alpha-L-rhamnosidase n=1 Tax=Halocatena pleomorpha TaxID=1785090 RepID=A0A3P3RF64_9EURY|nr:alpha-L-rhamnosidase [Halocatena pleomorpha]RRJ31400.1 alpha-L-rhamnosidase [Halocatena pleomorpha]